MTALSPQSLAKSLKPESFKGSWRYSSVSLLVCLSVLGGCSAVGPDYVKPTLVTPNQWKTEPGWRQAIPMDRAIKGRWWEVFGDADLNRLEYQTLTSNNNLALAQARLDQARAQTASANSSLLPRLGMTAGSTRSRNSADRPISQQGQVWSGPVQQSDFNAALNVSYELDLAGLVRRQIEGAKATEQQIASDFENSKLILTRRSLWSGRFWALKKAH